MVNEQMKDKQSDLPNISVPHRYQTLGKRVYLGKKSNASIDLKFEPLLPRATYGYLTFVHVGGWGWWGVGAFPGSSGKF